MQFTNITTGPKGLNTTLGQVIVQAGATSAAVDVYLREKTVLDANAFFSYSGTFTANPPSDDAVELAADSIDVIEAVTGTTYTVVPADNGKIKSFTSASSVLVTIPASIPAGFNMLVFVYGAGQVAFVLTGGVVRNASNHTKSGGQYAELSLRIHEPGVAVLSGTTGA